MAHPFADRPKLQEIIRQVQIERSNLSKDVIESYVLADWPEGQAHVNWLQTTSAREIANWVIEGLRGNYQDCDSCAEAGEPVPGVRHSTNREWSGYWLCEKCAAEYDQRPPVNAVQSA